MECRLCPRLSEFRDELQQRYPEYHNNPVESFGPTDARLLVVGLAPGLHGANQSGRPFTGDASGQLLFECLHRFGFASKGTSISTDDGMVLSDCRITNAVRCVPPQNKPTPQELNTCNRFLSDELNQPAVVMVLGGDALKAVALALGLPIVCLDHCGFSAVVDETCGIKIPVTSPKLAIGAIAAAIERLAQDENLRHRLATGAAQHAANFSWKKRAELLTSIYRHRLAEQEAASG